MLAKAIMIAAAGHSEQFDRAGQPYILHALKVMQTVKSSDSEVLQAAVLHDILEDTNITPEILLEKGFSKRVILILDALTHRKDEFYALYIIRISELREATLIKLADLRHNSDITRLKSVTDKDLARMKKYHDAYIFLKDALKKMKR